MEVSYSAPEPVRRQVSSPPSVAYSAPVSTQPLPDELTRAKLIWTTMVAIEQANESGNYSVLRDIASPSFQVANDPSRLTQIFAGIRSANIDLSNTGTELSPAAGDRRQGHVTAERRVRVATDRGAVRPDLSMGKQPLAAVRRIARRAAYLVGVCPHAGSCRGAGEEMTGSPGGGLPPGDLL
jgi:hypothetical protein